MVTEAVQLAIRTIGTRVVLTLPTNPGYNSQIEYKDDLNAPAWTPLGGTVMGTGAAILMTNTPASGPRFYRANIQ